MNEPIPHNEWTLRPEYADAVLDVLGRRWVGQGLEVERLEYELAQRFRPDGDCAVVSSGSAALYLARTVLGGEHWQAEKWVIPTYACSALYHASWGDPTFCDIDRETYNAVGPCSVYIHTYGVPGDVPPGAIEDFTHAPGSMRGDAPCGSLGALSVISFGATKPLGVGMGGAVLGPHDAIRTIRRRRDYDQSKERLAFNWQLGDVYAAMIRARLWRLSEENVWRWETACRYREANLRLWSPRRLHNEMCVYRYVIEVPDWREAQEWFEHRYGICTINPLRQDELLHRKIDGGRIDGFPNADAVTEHTLSLPIWPGMTEKQVGRVVEALAEFPI